ncbi:MAG: hypothetical protein BGN91_06680 [Nitrobacter sp. 62-13]|nr:MAG: hypothetical protein BGN91_06680 [Nitrobacter sp. 62-13]
MRPPPTEIRKLIVFVLAIAIAVYAVHGIIVDDLVMLYRVTPWRLRHYGYLHLRGMWAIGGAACLLLGAAGFAVLAFGVIGAKPKADPAARFYTKLATPLILIGAVFFLGVSFFSELFVR